MLEKSLTVSVKCGRLYFPKTGMTVPPSHRPLYSPPRQNIILLQHHGDLFESADVVEGATCDVKAVWLSLISQNSCFGDCHT